MLSWTLCISYWSDWLKMTEWRSEAQGRDKKKEMCTCLLCAWMFAIVEPRSHSHSLSPLFPSERYLWRRVPKRQRARQINWIRGRTERKTARRATSDSILLVRWGEDREWRGEDKRGVTVRELIAAKVEEVRMLRRFSINLYWNRISHGMHRINISHIHLLLGVVQR